MANGPYFYLRPDEELLLAQRPGAGYAVQIGLALVLPLVVLGGLAAALLPRFREVALGVLALALLLAIVFAWRRWATSEYVVTDQRLYARHGKLATSVHFTTHDKVTDLLLTQGLVQRLLGVSTLSFATAGGDVRMAGVRDALLLKARAESARDAHIQRLLERAGVERHAREGSGVPAAREGAPDAWPHATPHAAPRAEPAPLPRWEGPRPSYLKEGDEPAWMQKPAPISAITSARSLIGIVPVAAWLLFVRQLDAAPIVMGLLGFAFLMVAVRLTQLRRTEYFATDRRVYARSGVLGTTVSQLTYDKITDITYHQDLLGRLLGYGTVTLSTAGGGAAPVSFRGLRDALGAKETVERLRDRYLQEAR